MKTTIHSLIGMAAIVMLCVTLPSCSKKDNPDKKLTGSLRLNIGITVTENNDIKDPNADTRDFPVQILNSNKDTVISYTHASEIPGLLELPEGAYYAVASSNNSQAAAFENPYYQGNSGIFTIKAGQTSTVTINCLLSNIMITVKYSDRVMASYDNFCTIIHNSLDSLVFIKDEARAGYFNSGPLHIISNLYLSNSPLPSKIVEGDIAEPQPGKHYEVDVDALPVGGNAAFTINLNDSAETEHVTISDTGSEDGMPLFGDLLITEIMYNPDSLSDAEGEWIEIYNNSGNTINLKGLVIRRGSTGSFHQISSDVNLAAGAYVVLGRTSIATDNVGYVYGSSISLTNTGDEVMISTYGTNGTDGRVICSVNYGASGFLTNLNGKSLQLDPSVKDVNAAMIGSNWCAATQAYSTGDYGTPGMPNTNCD